MSVDPARILIVDDSPEDREVMRLLLAGAKRQLQFAEADSGASMLRACLEGPRDCDRALIGLNLRQKQVQIL